MHGSRGCCPVCVRIPEQLVRVATAVLYATKCCVTPHDTSTGLLGTFHASNIGEWYTRKLFRSSFVVLATFNFWWEFPFNIRKLRSWNLDKKHQHLLHPNCKMIKVRKNDQENCSHCSTLYVEGKWKCFISSPFVRWRNSRQHFWWFWPLLINYPVHYLRLRLSQCANLFIIKLIAKE